MAKKLKKLEADVVIAGGGPGGCTIARELSKKGKRVILIEKGGNNTRFFGGQLGTLTHIQKEPGLKLIRRSVEGDDLILGCGVGGGTLIYAGAAFIPDADLWKKYGIDITEDLDEAIKDCWVQEPPDDFIGAGTKRLWGAAQELGYPWEKLYRHVDFSKCKPGCEKCVCGCPKNAKWTGRIFADEAVRNGTTLLTHVTVRDVIVEGGMAGGVRALGPRGQRYEISGNAVVCCAGGVGTAPILKRSGLHDAGSWLAGDPAILSCGFVKDGKGNGFEHTMTVGFHDKEHGVVFGTCLQPNRAWHMQLLQKEKFGALGNLHRFGKALGVMCKIADELEGKVFVEGGVSKSYTARDLWRLEYSRVTSERILIKAGCDPYNIHHGPLTLGHPSGTVRVGKLLDSNLETPIKNLYCCDTSVVPEAPGMPPALTIVTLGKRLSRRLETIV